MNSICCALLLQPVRWHVKKKPKKNVEEILINHFPEIECHYCHFLSTGYEIVDPGTPMFARANDGWYLSSSAKRSLYGSKVSLNNSKSSKKTSVITMSARPSVANIVGNSTPRRHKESFTEKIEECPTEDCLSNKSPQNIIGSVRNSNAKNVQHYVATPATPTMAHPPFQLKQVSENKYLRDNKSNRSMKSHTFRNLANTFNLEKEVLNIARNKLEKYVDDEEQRVIKCNCEELRAKHRHDEDIDNQIEQEIDDGKKSIFTFRQKVFIFFDLDLLKDLTFINIMVGVTMANFAELNFSVLTPFVLDEFGLTQQQIAICMSLLGYVNYEMKQNVEIL